MRNCPKWSLFGQLHAEHALMALTCFKFRILTGPLLRYRRRSGLIGRKLPQARTPELGTCTVLRYGPCPIPAPFTWRPETGAPASGTVAERGGLHGWLMSGGRTSGPPSGEGPAPKAWDGNGGAKRPANPPAVSSGVGRAQARAMTATAVRSAPIGASRRISQGQGRWAKPASLVPSPPRPPLPDRAGPGYRAHSRHSALWAVAPGSVAASRSLACALLFVFGTELKPWRRGIGVQQSCTDLAYRGRDPASQARPLVRLPPHPCLWFPCQDPALTTLSELLSDIGRSLHYSPSSSQ